MIAWLIPFVAPVVGKKLAGAASWLLLTIIAALLLFGAYTVVYNKGASDKDAEWVEKIDKANKKAVEEKAKADALAAAQRKQDEARLAEQEKDYAKAISSAKDGAPSDAARALGCERLRRAGRLQDPNTAC